MGLATIDVIVVIAYAIFIFGLAQWVSREKGGKAKDTSDYFLASKNLPWWAIGASLIAANISAEQIVGMSGSGYVMGMAIASYEWMAALTLIIVGKWILPVFLKNGIYTMPEFLERRYSPGVRTVMAIFWLVLYVFVNLNLTRARLENRTPEFYVLRSRAVAVGMQRIRRPDSVWYWFSYERASRYRNRWTLFGSPESKTY